MALVMLLIARCSSDPAALQLIGGEVFIGHLLADTDARICYHASLFLQQRITVSCPDQYRKALRHLTQAGSAAQRPEAATQPLPADVYHA